MKYKFAQVDFITFRQLQYKYSNPIQFLIKINPYN